MAQDDSGDGDALGFDVILCTNRVTPYLATAVESVLRQTHRAWTLTLVDDGSDSPAALDALAGRDDRIRVVHQANQGLPAARNAGIRSTANEIVTFLDDDDVWPAGRLAAQAALLRAEPGCVAVFGDGRYIDGRGDVFGTWTTPDAPARDYLTGSAPLPRITTLAIRRDAFDRTGYFHQGFALAEDLEYTLRLVQAGELRGTGSFLVDYRRHPGNMTSSAIVPQYHAAERALQENVAVAMAAGRTTDAALLRRNLRRMRRGWAANSLQRGAAVWREGDRRAAVGVVLTSALSHPVPVVVEGLRLAGSLPHRLGRRVDRPTPSGSP